MLRGFNLILLGLQALACGFVGLMAMSNLSDGIRNPEAGLALALITPLVAIVSLVALGVLYVSRSDLPEHNRDTILMASAALTMIPITVLTFLMLDMASP